MKKIVKLVVSLALLLSIFGLASPLSTSAAASFIKPNDGSYTSYFGLRQLPNESVPDLHAGVDIGGNGSSLNIKASASGKVNRVVYNHSGLGNYIILRHTISGKTYDTLYAHLSSISVSNGQTVTQGSKIGVMGSTGNVTGLHLHFELHPNGYAGNSSAVNPIPYLTGDIGGAPQPSQPIVHSFDGSWATLRTQSPTGASTVNTFGHVGYGINGTLPTGSLYKVYEKASANGVDYFSVGTSKWIHRDNSEVNPYVATAKYTSPTLDAPGGTKINSLSPGDSYKTYGATTLSNGTQWYNLGAKGWVQASFVEAVRIP